MKQLKSYLSDKVDAELRKIAMERFGYVRGAISSAVEEAVVQWLKKEAVISEAIRRITEYAKKDDNVTAVLLFGSYARKEPAFNDVDIGILAKKGNKIDILRYTHLLEEDWNDLIQISIINDFPEWVQMHMIDEGALLQINDREELFRYSSDLILYASDNLHIAALLRDAA